VIEFARCSQARDLWWDENVALGTVEPSR